MLPPPQEIVEVRKSGGVLKWVALASGLVAAAAVVARKFLGSSDADWQAARPSAPYAPPARSATGSPDADSGDFTVADDVAPAGGAELGLGDDVEVGEKPTTGDRTISPSDPITVLADHSDTDSGGANPRH